jgi:hypothetical protein
MTSLPLSRQPTRRRTESAPSTRVPTRQMTAVEPKQAEPEVSEVTLRSVTQRATTRIERAITVGPEIRESATSSAASPIHTELFSESEAEPVTLKEAKSRRVSRILTQPVSRQPTRQAMRVSRQPAAREPTSPPISQSRKLI